jgi:hypothetical protein
VLRHEDAWEKSGTGKNYNNDTSCKYKVFGAQYRMGRDCAHDDVCGNLWVIYFLVIF